MLKILRLILRQIKEKIEMKINEVLETTAQELEAKKVEFGKKVLRDLKMANRIKVTQKEYRSNKNSQDYVHDINSNEIFYRIEYPEFTHDQIMNLYKLKNEIREYDYLMSDSKLSHNLGKTYSNIGIVGFVLSIIVGLFIGVELGPVGFVFAIAGLLVSINYFAIADVLKALERISANTAIKDKII